MKKNRAKTITIFLPDGNPRGVKIAEVTNRTVQAILIPRGLLKSVKERNEVSNVALYFLFGENDEETRTKAYIGEAESGYDRLKQHDSGKDFWEVAVMVVTNNSQNQFTKADVKFLEHLAYQEAIQAERYEIDQTVPTNPFIPEWKKEDLLDIFDTINLLLGTLGYPIFESYREPKGENQSQEEQELFYCNRRDANAIGMWTGDGFIVLNGSILSTTTLPAFESKVEKHMEKIQRFIEAGVLTEVDGRYVFQKDQPFKTPSSASSFIIQGASNGWVEWKDKTGKTLDELKRKTL